MSSLNFRAADLVDVPAVLELWQSSAENASRPVDTAAAVEVLIRRDPDALIVAADGEQLVGSIIAGWTGWRAHLYRLAVHPDRRREGIGRALLEAAESRLIGLGATRLDAMVLDGNELGERIWRSAGYVRQDDWGRWVKPV